MIHAQNHRIDPFFMTEALDDNDDPVGAYGDANPVSIDTAPSGVKYDHATVYIWVGTTDISVASLNVYEGDTAASGADDTDFSAISGATFSTLPSATDDNTFWRIDIDLRHRKRYLALELRAGDGTAGSFLMAFCVLSRAGQGPNSATEAGVSDWVRV